jgi:hypothetical protein
MRTLLRLVRSRTAGRRVIAKVDAEGAEGEIVVETPAEDWRVVDEAFVEVHDFTPYSSTQIRERLESAGLDVVSDEFNVLHVRRARV